MVYNKILKTQQLTYVNNFSKSVPFSIIFAPR